MAKLEQLPEFRKDPLTDLWVIISPERKKRPLANAANLTSEKEQCPFCPGNEDQTPPEIAAIRPVANEINESNWLVRVVPNKFPALVETSLDFKSHNFFYNAFSGIGVHEVVIETPEHDLDWASMSINQLVLILKTFRQRLLQIRKKKYLKYALIFKNSGPRAGASLTHPHSQIVSTPVLSTKATIEFKNVRKYYKQNHRCLICDLIEKELQDKKRFISQTERFIAFAPFASRFAFETWFAPKNHIASYEATDDETLYDFASLLQTLLIRYKAAIGLKDYNFLIHTAPFHRKENQIYHWRAELLPITTNMAGFERGAGFYINEVYPEKAANLLRKKM